MDFIDFVPKELFLPQVAGEAIAIGGAVALVKASVKRYVPAMADNAWFKLALEVAPLVLGVALAPQFIPEEAIVPRWAMGLVAGFVSSKAYSAAKAVVKARAADEVKKEELTTKK